MKIENIKIGQIVYLRQEFRTMPKIKAIVENISAENFIDVRLLNGSNCVEPCIASELSETE